MEEPVHRRVTAGVDVGFDPVAPAKEVGVNDVAVEDDALGPRVADTAAERARQALLDLVLHVDEVVAARHGPGLGFHLLDERQPAQALLGALERPVGKEAALHLAHLPAQHLVLDRARAGEADPAHVSPLARVHVEGDRHLLALRVDLGHGVDPGEGEALLAQPVGHQLRGLGEQAAGERLPGLGEDEPAQLVLGQHEVAGQLDVRDDVGLALVHVDRDEDVLAVRRDGHLGRVHLEGRVAPVHVERLELLQVAKQGLAGVPVVLLVERQPVRRGELEVLGDLLVVEHLVAHDVDLADAGPLTFGDVDRDVDRVVVRVLGDPGVHHHAVLAAAVVLVGQELGDVVQHGPVEGLAPGQADAPQGLFQVLGLDVLVALDRERPDGGSLLDDDDQGGPVAPELDVAEEPGAVNGPDGLLYAGVVELVADADRQVVVYRAFRDALQALDPHVPDHERFGGEDHPAGQDGQQPEERPEAACDVIHVSPPVARYRCRTRSSSARGA